MKRASGRALQTLIRLILLLCAFTALPYLRAGEQPAWPAITRETRPWTYWWWMASAVDKTNITLELQRYREAGFGGVHVIPIYGAKGFESRYIPYLSEQWFDMLDHTVREAERLDMGVDMTTGTGWCFGGPNVRDHEANAAVQLKRFDVSSGAKFSQRFPTNSVQALVAFAPDGKPTDLTSAIQADGSIAWTPSLDHTVFVVSQKPSGQKVKRSAPGGEGHMLNLLYRDGVDHWLQRFTDAFASYRGARPRAMYHDSYEYRSDWSPDFFTQFEKRRGYRLQDELPQLVSREQSDRAARVKCDYRETASDILSEETIPLWVRWSHERGFKTRNQAHGSPGNLLDLYAAVDTPETEMFNRDRNKLISKVASSAAHVAGRRLVSSETGTWLREHFTERLADVKYLIDDLFLSGVNHIFYHGTCYSPDEAPWPGWLFYASTEMNPRNPIWRDVPVLNAYAARCQAVLQSGSTDNDLLVYWPIHDYWRGAGGMLPHLTVHARGWFEEQSIGKAAEHLWQRGYAFDYISDRQLSLTRAEASELATAGGHYRAILVPHCQTMPLATLQRLLSLAKNGGLVLFEQMLPADVPGLANLDQQRTEFKSLLATLTFADQPAGFKEAKIGRGKVLVGSIDAMASHISLRREPLVELGLSFVRRTGHGHGHYFIANRGSNSFSGWVSLGTPFRSATLLDPLFDTTGAAKARPAARQIFLQLEPGHSIIVRTHTNGPAPGPAWDYTKPADTVIPLSAPWTVEFISGGPVLPASKTVNALSSWTDIDDPDLQRFAGTARYSTRFDAPATSRGDLFIDLGYVQQSVRVRLNGIELGTLVAPPFRLLARNVRPKENLLEVEVTSVAANRIRDLDRRGVKWRTFHDINFVNMDYKPFDASNWPVHAAGLLGPVTLRHLESIRIQ
jgi:hypothetical protein